MVQAYSIGKGKRKDLADSPMTKLTPGPGTYAQTTNTMRSMPSWGFGTGKRPKMAISQASAQLGPGEYQIPQKAVEGAMYSIGGINNKLKKYGSISPGPGAYKPRDT
jgi:hypothetical protein